MKPEEIAAYPHKMIMRTTIANQTKYERTYGIIRLQEKSKQRVTC